MKKGLKKTIVSGLISVFVLSLIAGLTPLDLVQPVSAASSKKAPIHINNTAGSALSYYQVNLNITYDSDMNNDFSDLRVKNETAGAFVPYWIENKSDGAWCNLWFNATGIPASSWCNDTYYLYYGDVGASSASNITTTFPFGDDFDYTGNELTELWALESGATQPKSMPFKLYDYNNDSIDDVYSVDADGEHFYVFDFSGNELVNVSLPMHYGSYSRTSGLDVGDINDDGEEEIMFTEHYHYQTTNPAYIRVINTTGHELWNKSFSSYGESLSLKTANFTSTSGLETVVAFGNASGGRIYMFDKDGNEEWFYEYGKWSECRGIDVGDFNGDGQNDVFSIYGEGSGFVVLHGNNGTLLWENTTCEGETMDVQDINNDGEDDLVVGCTNYFSAYWGNGTSYWAKTVSDDAELITWSPEKIDVGSGLEWLALSTGKHQKIYIQHQDGTDYKSLSIGSYSWTGHFSKLGGTDWKIVVGKDNGYSLGVYDLNLSLLASISGVGKSRHIESYGNKIFVTSTSNPNQYAIYEYTEGGVGSNLTDKWELRNSPTVSDGELECIDDEYVVSINSYDIHGMAIESKVKIISGACQKSSLMIGDLKNSTETQPQNIVGQDAYAVLRDADRSRGWRLDSGSVVNLYDNTTFYSGIDCSIFRKFKLTVQDNSPNYTTKHWHEKGDLWYEENSENWNHTSHNMYVYLGLRMGTTLLTSRTDYVFLRKYTSPEPTSLLGTEQSTGGGANASVTVSDGSITFGNLQLSTTKNTVTSGDTQVINTTGASGNQEIEIKLSSSTVTGTTNGTVLTFVSGSPGQNQLLCQFKGGDVGSYTALTTAYYEFDNSMANNSNANLDIQLTMPSSVSNNNYYDDYQFEITVRATLL